MRPPERILSGEIVLFESQSHAPTLIVRERVSILLEQGVDARNTAIPRVFQVLQCETTILRLRFLTLQRVLSPHALGIVKFSLPRLDVAEQVRNELIFFVRHSRAEVRDARVGLHAVPQVALGDENVTHREHTQTTDFFRCGEHARRETARHLRIQTNFYASLNLILTLHQQIKQLRGVNCCLSVVRHQADERRVPLVDNLGKRRRTG
mmetsp:Transcript_6537/g.26220  ORF Transcript_6537/g.26220 Transcript_6537/m.26220 type:complete len:208 (+) Transcript_6537:3427-4050(+)